ADNGPGIAPEAQPRIWEIFQTLGDAGEEASGIGLAVVKRIVEGRGGRARGEASLGGGGGVHFVWRLQPRTRRASRRARTPEIFIAVLAASSCFQMVGTWPERRTTPWFTDTSTWARPRSFKAVSTDDWITWSSLRTLLRAWRGTITSSFCTWITPSTL